MSDSDIDEASALGDRISPLLAGHSPEVQGAVLAFLTAVWVSGHIVPGDQEATRELRDRILAFHYRQVRKHKDIPHPLNS